MEFKSEKLAGLEPEIDRILETWGFSKSVAIEYARKKTQLLEWLSNFQYSEIEDALKIASKITVISETKVRNLISSLAKEISREFDGSLGGVLFFPLGDNPSESGGNYLYDLRKELGLPAGNFPTGHFANFASSARAMIFIDDIIGTGQQATKFAEKNRYCLSENSIYISLFAFDSGLKKVQAQAEFRSVFCGQLLTSEDIAFTESSKIFRHPLERERLKCLAEKYGRLLYPLGPLGYDNSQAMIVFPHNTPNNTLPIIWASDRNEKTVGAIWHPLWERRKPRKSRPVQHLRFSPEDTEIDLANSDGPPGHLAYLGHWFGVWTGGVPGKLDHSLVVSRVENARAELIYFSGECQEWNVQVGDRRAFADFQDGSLVLEWPETWIRYRMIEEGIIEAERIDPLGTFKCHMNLIRK